MLRSNPPVALTGQAFVSEEPSGRAVTPACRLANDWPFSWMAKTAEWTHGK